MSKITEWRDAVKHARDIPDETVIELVRACCEARCNGDETWGWHGGRPGWRPPETWPTDMRDDSEHPKSHWANRFDIAKALGLEDKEKVVLAKLRRLILRGEITGCYCGCRGDFEIP